MSPRCDWSASGFGWMQVRPMTLGHAAVTAMSVSFSGELAYELHVPNEQLYLVWQLMSEAGAAFKLSKFGLYATESMRLEKGYLHWKADIIDEFNPMEAGLERFVNLNKTDFVGKSELLKAIDEGLRHQLVSFEIMSDVAPAHGGGPVFQNGQQVGVVSSGGYGHRVGKNLAYAYVTSTAVKNTDAFSIRVIGEDYKATPVERCLYDPENLKPRSMDTGGNHG